MELEKFLLFHIVAWSFFTCIPPKNNSINSLSIKSLLYLDPLQLPTLRKWMNKCCKSFLMRKTIWLILQAQKMKYSNFFLHDTCKIQMMQRKRKRIFHKDPPILSFMTNYHICAWNITRIQLIQLLIIKI